MATALTTHPGSGTGICRSRFTAPSNFAASSDFDITQRITFSGGWDLPFDRAWGSGPRRLIKGWSLYPILSWRTGFPLSINAGESLNPQDPGPSGAGDANLVNAAFAPGFNGISLLNPHSSSTLNGTTGNFYFNPAAFTVPDLRIRLTARFLPRTGADEPGYGAGQDYPDYRESEC